MTTLTPELLRNCLLVASFRGEALDSVCAFLLLLGLKLDTLDAGMLPAELLAGDRHLAGIATASLLAQELLEVCGRVRSSSPLANGRKCSLLRIPEGRAATVRRWLEIRGYVVEQEQLEMAV